MLTQLTQLTLSLVDIRFMLCKLCVSSCKLTQVVKSVEKNDFYFSRKVHTFDTIKMVSEQRRAYLKAYREKMGPEFKQRQRDAQRKHRALYPEKTRETSRVYQRRHAAKMKELIAFAKRLIESRS